MELLQKVTNLENIMWSLPARISAYRFLNIDGQQKSQSFDFKVKSIPHDPVASGW